jgi:hypothetical protein
MQVRRDKRAQELINAIRQYGLGDADIGALTDVSREWINRVRQGKRRSSHTLHHALEDILTECQAGDLHAHRKPYTRKAPAVSRTTPWPGEHCPYKHRNSNEQAQASRQAGEPSQHHATYSPTGVYSEPY